MTGLPVRASPLANDVGLGLFTLCPPRLRCLGTVAVDKAWITPPAVVPRSEGSVFVSPGGQFLMSLDSGLGSPKANRARAEGSVMLSST